MLFSIRILLLTLCTGISLCATEPGVFRQQRMLGDLDNIKNIFQSNYAPAEWKKAHFGWDVETQISLLQDQVASEPSITIKKFHQLLKEYFHAVKDYHVSIEFYSTETATLPFMVKHAGDRYFFTYVDKEQCANIRFPFTIGDELISMDGIPIDQYVANIVKQEIGENYEGTDYALAEIYLTTRQGTLGHVVPSGQTTIVGKKKGSHRPVEQYMQWNYRSEGIHNAFAKKSKMMLKRSLRATTMMKRDLSDDPFFQRQLTMPQYDAIKKARAGDSDPSDMIGSKVSFVPPLGKRLGTPLGNIFHAYLFELPGGKRGGYIRIPEYKADDLDAAVSEFADLISNFQQQADVLVIDQVNNPGGLLLYMYSLLTMLTDRPLEVPKHRQMITQQDVYFALEEKPEFDQLQTDEEARNLLGKMIVGMPVTLKIARSFSDYYQFVIDEWNEGRYYTEPGYVYGVDFVTPNPDVHFTKPILVLVNGLDFSGGDFFPAIMQDNKRAKIFGSRTAGAGGILGKTSFPNLSGIAEVSYTTSLAVRPGNRLLENYGVTPDVKYQFTVEDLQNNYSDYGRKVEETLTTMIKRR